MAGAERALGVHEDVYGLLHRPAFHAQRTIVRAMDSVISRFAEAPAIRDERVRAIRTILRAEDRGRRPSRSCLPFDRMFRIVWLGATHTHVLQGTSQPGEDAGHRREL